MTNVAKDIMQHFFIILYNIYIMLTFIKGSIRELKHVVWPTRQETQSYFMMVLVTLILFGLYLFIANTIFSEVILKILPKIV